MDEQRQALIEQAINPAYYYDEMRVWFRETTTNETRELLDALALDGISQADVLQEWARHAEIIAEATATVEGYFDKHNVFYRHNDSLAEKLAHFANQVERDAAGQFNSVNSFRDTVITELTGQRLVVDMAMSAATHREKDARLRGLEEMINRGIRRLQDVHFELFRWQRWPQSVFASDSAEARLMRQNWELEDQLKKYQAQFGKLPSADAPAESNDDLPW
jgi:hypothetical protein